MEGLINLPKWGHYTAFSINKKMVSILHKKTRAQSGNAQAHDVRKIKTNPNSQHLNKPCRISPSFISNSIVKKKEGAEEGLDN